MGEYIGRVSSLDLGVRKDFSRTRLKLDPKRYDWIKKEAGVVF